MNFDWMQYLEIAKILASNTENPFLSEGMFRSSVSRAYYCAYHFAFNAAINTGFNPHKFQKNELHRALVNHFIGSSDSTTKKVGRNLERILNNRQNCDYSPTLTDIPQSMANTTIGLAEQIIKWSNGITS